MLGEQKGMHALCLLSIPIKRERENEEDEEELVGSSGSLMKIYFAEIHDGRKQNKSIHKESKCVLKMSVEHL